MRSARVLVPVFALIAAACAPPPPPVPAPVPQPPAQSAPPPPAAPVPQITGPLATVKTVQPPVMRVRAGKKAPLRPGDEVMASDRIETGKGARIHVALRDNSTLKLGQDAAFELPKLKAEAETADSSVLQAAFSVLKGAFRYTSQALASSGWKHDIDVRIGATVTAGVRGTDIWGRADDTQEMICLIEGRIEAGRAGEPPAVMDQPNTYYQIPAGQAPKAVGPASGEQLADWVAQTEMDPAQPTLAADGAWMVVVESFRDTEGAALFAAQLSDQGYPVEVREAVVKGKTLYRVLIPGYASSRAARSALPGLEKAFARKGLWVLKNKPADAVKPEDKT